MTLPRDLLLAVFALSAGCVPVRPPAPASAAPRGFVPPGAIFRLVETAPVETTLRHPDLPAARDTWPMMVASARRSIELGAFYVVDEGASALTPVLRALEAAADRGVEVRIIAEKKFLKIYPEPLGALSRHPHISVRAYDVASVMGGVHHAKYLIVDGREAYLGSQNFDWRSLEHIQELGVRFDSPPLVGALSDVFETDWRIAGGGDPGARVVTTPASRFPAAVPGVGRVTFVASPRGFLPDEALWDLPRLVAMIQGAKRSICVQVLTYGAVEHGKPWPELDDALRGAVARGVRVRLLVSDWAKKLPAEEQSKRAEGGAPLDIRMVTIPQASSGPIPFARVVHAKYLAVDGERAWVGTSNWEESYFTRTRNVGLVIEGSPVPLRLEAFFEDLWSSSYARPVLAQP